MKPHTALSPEQRRDEILDLARHASSLTVEEIASRFGVSRETARRDLGVLEHRGLVRRTHGGASAPRLAGEASFLDRQRINTEAKRSIARAAACLFRPGETLMIDTGSTTEAFASALSVEGLIVVTNSIRIARAVSSPGTTYVVGGAYRAETEQMLGSHCIEQLRKFRADHAILGIGALSDQGEAMDYDLEEAQCARAMIEQSARVTLLVDSSKIGRQALASVCRPIRIDRIVTDRPLPPVTEAALRRSKTEIIVADAEHAGT